MASSEAPGPDAAPAEVYKGLPSMACDLARLFAALVRRCVAPRELLEMHIVPLVGPRRDPSQRAYKQPTSLISVIMKILEAAIYNRIAHVIEPAVHPLQYAHRRSRGCEMHLAALTDFAAGHLREGRFVYLASLDMGGAFDSVAHDGLLASLWEAVSNAYFVSFAGTWLKGGNFRKRILAPEGGFFSERAII